LLRNYGSRYEEVLRHVYENPEMRRTVGRSTTIRAQVLHAVRHEMAETLEDIVFRRTDLATGVYPGRGALRECAAILAAERGLAREELEGQVERVMARFPASVVSRVDAAEAGATREPAPPSRASSSSRQ
jgi:glycerol-3-phosphate dehydrogenase